MGRADLSSHRKSSPSDTRPIRFPPNVAWVLPKLSDHPHLPIARAINTIESASTQRAQVQAVKLLGISLRDAHVADGQKHPVALKCACTLPHSDVIPICSLAVPVLVALLFATPAATAGLTSASLRAVLTCNLAGISGFDDAVQAFVARIARWKERGAHADEGKSDDVRENECFLQAAADVSALAVVLAEQQSRSWVLDKEDCVFGALALISDVADLYRSTTTADHSRPVPRPDTATALKMEDSISVSINRSMLEAACDSSMKAGQDIINFVLKLQLTSEKTLATEWMKSLARATISCKRVLELPMAPRNCSMACSVAYVSGILFQFVRDGTPETITQVLRERVLSRLDRFPPFSQLSLLRGVMEAQAAKPAVPLLLFPLDIAEGETRDGDSVFGLLASITTASSDVHLRFLAMDALIVCLRRLAPEKLSAHCRKVVLSLVYERWQEPFPGVSSQIRETMEALVAVDGGDEEATSFWLSMGRSLIKGDWQSKGMYAPLNVLVKRLGALRFLDAEPNCQCLALHAAGTDSRLAKPASDWLAMFWTVLWRECLPATTRFFQLTSKALLASLVDECNTSLRERTTEYMLPAYLRAVGQENIEDTAGALLNCLETMSPYGSASRIRGTICIMSAARQCGVFIGSFSDHTTCNLLQQALRSGLEDLRSSALDLIVTSRVSTEPISEEEVDLVRSYLPSALMPGGSPSDRSRFRHSMRRFTERLAACRHAARDGSGGWWMRERKERYHGLRTVAFEKQRTDLQHRIATFERDCISILLSSAYPGAPFARMTNSLEVMLLVSKNLSCRESFPSIGPQAEASVIGVVACLLDEWERPRRSALQVLTSLDDPVAGFEALGTVKELQMFALPLLDSPRQKDVDSGASVFRCIFRKYVLRCPGESDVTSPRLGEECFQENLLFCKNDEMSHALSPIHMSPGLAYASSVLDSLETSAGLADQDFMGSCERGLFHGRCLLLRYIVQDLPWKELSSPSNFVSARKLVRRFLDLYWRCTRIAMDGVAFQSFDQMRDVLHHTNSDDVNGADTILLDERKQLVSTSSFLSVKEICVSLGILCHEVPFANVAGVDDECHGILTFEQIASVVELFRFVFTSTRHWGVIDGASEGLQLLCERLLQTSSANLRALPSQLVAKCMSSALGGELYVLRRSAGIPSLFSAILNAEAAGHSRCHETPLLHRVVTDLLQHLQITNMYTDEASLRESRSQEEESVAHALNLLRSMFLNGNIASNILKYLESAAMACINAFCSASWLIRNSAMMLFSSLMRRGIGVCVERRSSAPLSSFEVAGGTSATLDGERRLRGVTAFQFFSRHPRLHPFLLQQLQTAVGRFEYHHKRDHPALFPTLYLLSSLSPAAAEDPTASLSMAPFRAVLRKCLHWRSNYVRRAAAAASIPLIEDPGHVAGVVEEYLCAGVPPEPDNVCRPNRISAVVIPNGKTLVSPEPRLIRLVQNRLHGELLAIAAVLKGTSRTMSLVDKLNTVRVLAKRLPSRTWIATHGHLNPCSVTRSSMLVVLGRSYELSRDVRNTPTITDKDLSDADFVLALCKKVALELHENEVEKHECGVEVGLSSFLGNSAKLLGLITVSSFENGEISLGNAVQLLSRLIFSAQREAMRIGMDSAVQVLELDADDRNSAENFKVWSPDVGNSLHRLWDRAVQVLSSFDDQELLVEALRLITTVLVRNRKFSGNFVILSMKLKSENLASILQIAKSHSCVDVREHAIVLSGQLISVTELHEKLVLEWISVIEDATTALQPPTTRMAGSTSFENSGFGSLGKPDRVGMVEEVTVRGFLVLAHLLDDENVEVRNHVTHIIYRCKQGTSSAEDAFPSDILPSLMWIYDLLCARFSRSRSFSRHMQDLFAVPDVPVESDEQERLTSVIECIVRTKSLEKASKIASKVRKATFPASSRTNQPLFRLEDDACNAEIVVRLQLVAWSYRKIIMRSPANYVPHNVKAQLCTDLVNALRDDLVQDTQQSGTGIIGENVFTRDGFRRCYRSALRLLLGIACLQATSLDDRRELMEAQSSLSKQLTEVLLEVGEVVHAALLSAITGIRNLLNDKHSDEENNLQKVFFLLLQV